MSRIKNFLRDEEGMETLEYALIAGLIAAAAVIVYSTGWANALATKLNNAVNTSAS
jgi:Flp pilus assembly pilin Flp